MENDYNEQMKRETRIKKALFTYLIFVLATYLIEWAVCYAAGIEFPNPITESEPLYLTITVLTLCVIGWFTIYRLFLRDGEKIKERKTSILEDITLYGAALGPAFTPILPYSPRTSSVEDLLIILLIAACLCLYLSVRDKNIQKYFQELEKRWEKAAHSKKLIIAQGVSLEEIDKDIRENTNYINTDRSNSMQLWRLEESRFAITFPYGVDHSQNFVNIVEDLSAFIETPNAHEIMGWTETEDLELPGNIVLYRYSTNNKEVYATTEDGQIWIQNTDLSGNIFKKDNGRATFIPRPEINWKNAEKLTLYDKRL